MDAPFQLAGPQAGAVRASLLAKGLKHGKKLLRLRAIRSSYLVTLHVMPTRLRRKCALARAHYVAVVTGKHADAISSLRQPRSSPSAHRATAHDIAITLLDVGIHGRGRPKRLLLAPRLSLLWTLPAVRIPTHRRPPPLLPHLMLRQARLRDPE